MAVAGFLDLEFFVKVSGLWQSLGVQRVLPSVDASGIETFDRNFSFSTGSAIGDPAGDDLRVTVVGRGASSSTDKITGFPGVTWQVDGTAPTETAVAQRVKVKVSPNNA